MGMKLPPLNAIRMFDAAARHESFKMAAAELNVTPGAVGQQVRALEDWLGFPLFLRQARAVSLTEAGSSYARDIHELLQGLESATRRALNSTSKVVTLSVTPGFGARWLVPRLETITQDAPGVDLRISATHRAVDLDNEAVDMAIRHLRLPPPGLQCELLVTAASFPVCSPSLLAPDGPLRRPEDLRHVTLLHSLYDDNWRVWLDRFSPLSATEIREMRGIVFDQTTMTIDSVLRGQGVALTSEALVADYLQSGQLVRPFDGLLDLGYGFNLVYPRNRPLSPQAALVRSRLHLLAGNPLQIRATSV